MPSNIGKTKKTRKWIFTILSYLVDKTDANIAAIAGHIFNYDVPIIYKESVLFWETILYLEQKSAIDRVNEEEMLSWSTKFRFHR
jgi:hypothetical protein